MDESMLRADVWRSIQEMNRAWTVERAPARLREFFHRDMIAVTATDRHRIDGREACVASWARFAEAAHVSRWVELEPKVQLHCGGTVAVVSYEFEIAFEMDGRIRGARWPRHLHARERGRALVDRARPLLAAPGLARFARGVPPRSPRWRWPAPPRDGAIAGPRSRAGRTTGRLAARHSRSPRDPRSSRHLHRTPPRHHLRRTTYEEHGAVLRWRTKSWSHARARSRTRASSWQRATGS